MTFTWTRDGERITSTCPRCYATKESRFLADLRRCQAPTPTPARPVEARIRFTQPTQETR